MNAFDVVILALAAGLGLLGAFRGLIRMALGIGGLVVGILLAIRWEERATPAVKRVLDSDLWAPMVAFVGIVVVVVLAAVAARILLRRLVKLAHLAWMDRALGVGVGLMGALLLSAALSIFLAAGLPGDSRLLADSTLAPVTLRVSGAVVRLAPLALRKRFDDGMARFRASV